jgi:hypothetical protein
MMAGVGRKCHMFFCSGQFVIHGSVPASSSQGAMDRFEGKVKCSGKTMMSEIKFNRV